MAIDKVKQKLDQLQYFKEMGVLKESEGNKIGNLTRQLDIMRSRLEQSKTEAQQTGEAIEDALSPDDSSGGGEKKLNGLVAKMNAVKKSAKEMGSRIASSLSKNGLGKAVDSIGKKIDGLRKRITGIFMSVVVFNVLSKALTKLRDGFVGLLSTNDTFNTSLAQIRGNLMTAFAPIYNAILPAINTLMSALVQITATIAKFTSSLFGISTSNATKQAKKLSSALGQAGEEGKEASGALADFDKLQVIGGSDNDKSSGGGGGGAEYDYSGVTEANQKLLDIMNKIKDMIVNGEWGELAKTLSKSLIKVFNGIANKIKSIDWASIGEGISEFLTNIDFSGILVSLVSIFGEALLAFQTLFLTIDWPTILANFSAGIRDAINKITEYLGQIKWSEIGKKLGDSFTAIDWAGIGNSILDFLWSSLSGILDLFLGVDWAKVGKSISDAVNSWIKNIIQKFKDTDWLQLGKDIANAIMDFILNVDWGQLGINILEGLIEGLKAMIEFLLGVFQTILDRILEFFGVHSPSTVFKDLGINLLQGLINGIKSLKDSAIQIFKDIWTGITQVFSKVATFFKDTFTKAWTAVKNVFSTGGKIFDGIKDGIVNAFKNIVNGIISGINKVIKVPFDGINSALKKIKSIEIMGAKPFGGLPTISVPQIPKLAKGAVIPPRQEFAAILGDQKHGTNIEAPLDTIKQANKEVLEEFFNQMRNWPQDAMEVVLKNITFVLQFGTGPIQKLILNAIRMTEKEIGKQLLVN